MAKLFMKAIALAASLLATPSFASDRPLGGALSKDTNLWQRYVAQFVASDGRVIDNVNGGISHTESQGYGMLLAVAANDKATFDRIWSFTETNMFVREDGLAAWKYEPLSGAVASVGDKAVKSKSQSEEIKIGQITDMNNATDGDILIAWALAEAGSAGFGDEYAARAKDLSLALRSTVYQAGGLGLQIMPGKIGFSAGERDGKPVVNLSYWVFPAFDRLSVLMPMPMWPELTKSGMDHIIASQNFAAGLPSDWFSLDVEKGERATAAGLDDSFGYNAIRIPLYLAMTGPKSRRMLRATFHEWFALEGPLKTVGVNDRSLRDNLVDPGYEAIRSLYKCATSSTPFPPETLKALDLNYYPATLQMLAVLAARQSYPKCV